MGAHEIGHQCRKIVILPELELLHRHRVILINDRHDAGLQQRRQRIARIEKALAV